MHLYHGSNKIIETPDLKFSRKELDFGAGFYTTTNYEQAKEFSEKVVERAGGERVVSIYEFDNEALKNNKLLIFPEPNINWLKIKKLYNQYVFKSDFAINQLQFIKAEVF